MDIRMGMAAGDNNDQSSKPPASIGRGTIFPKPPLVSITSANRALSALASTIAVIAHSLLDIQMDRPMSTIFLRIVKRQDIIATRPSSVSGQ